MEGNRMENKKVAVLIGTDKRTIDRVLDAFEDTQDRLHIIDANDNDEEVTKNRIDFRRYMIDESVKKYTIKTIDETIQTLDAKHYIVTDKNWEMVEQGEKMFLHMSLSMQDMMAETPTPMVDKIFVVMD